MDDPRSRNPSVIVCVQRDWRIQSAVDAVALGVPIQHPCPTICRSHIFYFLFYFVLFFNYFNYIKFLFLFYVFYLLNSILIPLISSRGKPQQWRSLSIDPPQPGSWLAVRSKIQRYKGTLRGIRSLSLGITYYWHTRQPPRPNNINVNHKHEPINPISTRISTRV